MMRSMPSFYFPIAGENFSLHCISKQKMGQQKQDRAENQYQRCDDRSWRSSSSLKPKYTVDGAWDPYCLCWWAHASQAWSQSCPPGVSHSHPFSKFMSFPLFYWWSISPVWHLPWKTEVLKNATPFEVRGRKNSKNSLMARSSSISQMQRSSWFITGVGCKEKGGCFKKY